MHSSWPKLSKLCSLLHQEVNLAHLSLSGWNSIFTFIFVMMLFIFHSFESHLLRSGWHVLCYFVVLCWMLTKKRYFSEGMFSTEWTPLMTTCSTLHFVLNFLMFHHQFAFLHVKKSTHNLMRNRLIWCNLIRGNKIICLPVWNGNYKTVTFSYEIGIQINERTSTH